MSDRTQHCAGCKEAADRIAAQAARIAKLEAELGHLIDYCWEIEKALTGRTANRSKTDVV